MIGDGGGFYSFGGVEVLNQMMQINYEAFQEVFHNQ